MSGHTPGPWRICPADDAEDSFDSSGLPFFIAAQSDAAFARWGLMGDGRGTRVAYIACNPHARTQPEWATVEANARLIAAAPDLLAALMRAVNDMEEMAYSVVTLAGAREAIAKATGEAAS